MQALYETITTSIFALMPFWFVPLFGQYIYIPPPSFSESFQRGEGLVYAAALLGPLAYALTKRYGKFNLRGLSGKRESSLSMSFPYGGAFVLITILTCAFAGYIYGHAKTTGWDSTSINQEGVKTLSYFMILISTLIFFLVTAYKNMLDDIEKNKGQLIIDSQPRQEDQFADRWKEFKS